MNKKQIMDPKNRNEALAYSHRAKPRRTALVFRWLARAEPPYPVRVRRKRNVRIVRHKKDPLPRAVRRDMARGERRPGPPKPDRYISIGYDLAPSGRRSCAE